MRSAELTGQRLGHYRILELLGAGGMGEVYLAEDTSLERKVALKILPRDIASDPERMRRFVREAKAASAIDHPNIVHVYEINEADGLPFIAMQYVEGRNLHQRIGGVPMPNEELLQTAIQVVEAIGEAHARGIIHRDLKSQNVMLSSKGQVKLLDFGLARVLQPDGGNVDSEVETVSRTATGRVLGTAGSMSPEQALGREIDQRTDIFSLGVLLYEMSTGRLPFTGRSAIETIDRVIHSQPQPVSELNHALPPGLERIVRKCMEKEPSRRYQSASDLLAELRQLRPDPSESSKSDGTRRINLRGLSPLTATLAVVFVVLSLAGLAGLYRYRQPSGQEIRSLAVLPFKNINLDPKTEYLSDGITDSIINNVSLIRQIRVMARGTVWAYKNREVDPREAGKDLGVDGVVTGKLLQEGNSLLVTVNLVDTRTGRQVWGEQYDRAPADILPLQSEISKKISDKLRVNLTEKEENLVARQYTTNTEAYQAFLKGQFFLLQRTEQGTRQAIDYFRQAVEKDPSYALAYDGLASGYSYLGISGALLGGSPPKEVVPTAKENVLKAIELDPTLAQPHVTLGNIYFNYDFDWAGAEQEFNKAAELNPNDSFIYVVRGFFYLGMGRDDEVRASMQRFRELDPGYSPGTLIGLGIEQYLLRRYDVAIEQFRKINELSPHFPTPYFYLGACYVEKGEYPSAIGAFQKAVAYSQHAPLAVIGLGTAFARAGRMKEADAIAAEIDALSRTRYIPEFYRAWLYTAMGRKDEAITWLNTAYEEHANGVSLIKRFPMLDDLRPDPRFQALLRRLNFPG